MSVMVGLALTVSVVLIAAWPYAARMVRRQESTRETPFPLLARDARETPLRPSAEFPEFAQAAGGGFDLDLVTGQVRGTALFFDLLGLPDPHGLFTRDEWWATIHPHDLEAVIAALNAAIGARGGFDVEYRSLQLDGTPRRLAARGRVIDDAQGYAARAVGTVTDVTAARKL